MAGATELSNAKGLSVPDEVKGAQQQFVDALQMRKDGMNNIAGQVQPALNSTTSKDAVNTIAAEMARFYASDVLYKDYTVPQIVGALRAAGITVGGLGGQQLKLEPVSCRRSTGSTPRTSPPRSTCRCRPRPDRPRTSLQACTGTS